MVGVTLSFASSHLIAQIAHFTRSYSRFIFQAGSASEVAALQEIAWRCIPLTLPHPASGLPPLHPHLTYICWLNQKMGVWKATSLCGDFPAFTFKASPVLIQIQSCSLLLYFHLPCYDVTSLEPSCSIIRTLLSLKHDIFCRLNYELELEKSFSSSPCYTTKHHKNSYCLAKWPLEFHLEDLIYIKHLGINALILLTRCQGDVQNCVWCVRER